MIDIAIAILCLVARYFWLFKDLIDDRCPTGTTLACLTNRANYADEWFVNNMMAYIVLVLLDYPYWHRYRMILRWGIIIGVAHVHRHLRVWLLLDFTDAFYLIIISVIEHARSTPGVKRIVDNRVDVITQKYDMSTQTYASDINGRPSHSHHRREFPSEFVVTKCAQLLLEQLETQNQNRQSVGRSRYSRSRTPVKTKPYLQRYIEDETSN